MYTFVFLTIVFKDKWVFLLRNDIWRGSINFHFEKYGSKLWDCKDLGCNDFGIVMTKKEA
jgi:hypothetical protein